MYRSGGLQNNFLEFDKKCVTNDKLNNLYVQKSTNPALNKSGLEFMYVKF